jgi:hypothetical protein
MNIFNRSKSLLRGYLYELIDEYSTFTHFRSIFDYSYYNFIVPKVGVDLLDLVAVKRLVKSESVSGKQLSFYINENMADDYSELLKSLGYNFLFDDTYMYKRIVSKYDTGSEFESAKTEDFNEYLQTSKICFPEWNSDPYISFCFGTNQSAESDIFNRNIVIRRSGKIASFGSVIVSGDLSLGYLHNAGTVPEFRGRGMHSELIKIRSNTALSSGADTTFTIVEEGGNSYRNMVKMGYKKDSRFLIFTT